MIRAALVALGLMLWALPQAAHAQDFGNCTDRGYLSHFDPRLAAQPCDEIATAEIHWRGGTARLRAIHPHAMAMADSALFIARINEVAGEIGVAMDQMGGTNLHLDNVTILFTSYVSPRSGPDEGFDKGAYTAAASDIFAHECPVSYYKGSHATVDGDDFVFVLAHEVFHCIQYRTWPRMLDEDWLTEGSAEYFAYLAKPGYGAGFIPRFDAQIPGVALDHLDYSAVVFYLWLDEANSPARVADFIGSTRSLVSGVSPDMWIEFAQAYFDQRIHLPDGRPLPSSPRIGATRTIHGDDHLQMPAMVPYTLNNAVFAFDRDKVFTLTYTPNPADVRVRWRQAAGGAWGEPLTSVTTCAGEQRFRVIWTSTRSTSGGSIDVRSQPASAGVCTCPAGAWQETDQSLRHMMEQSAFGGSQTRFISGGRLLQLNPDHTGSFTYQSVVTETHSTPDFWLRQTKTGGTHFTWTLVNGMLLTRLAPGDNLLNLHNEQHSASGVLVENRRAGAQSIGHAFSCDASGLHLTQHNLPPSPIPGMAPISVDMDFVRVGGALGH